MLGSLPPIKSRLARPSPVQPGLQMLAREPRNQRWGPEPSSQAARRSDRPEPANRLLDTPRIWRYYLTVVAV
jgi:hypothetical protein